MKAMGGVQVLRGIAPNINGGRFLRAPVTSIALCLFLAACGNDASGPDASAVDDAAKQQAANRGQS